MVRNARREARRRRLVPRRETRAARQLADCRLGQIDVIERAPDSELPSRLTPWPVVAAIVSVGAIDDRGEAAFAGNPGQGRVQLLLAVVAAIDRVRAVVRPLELARANHLVPQREV